MKRITLVLAALLVFGATVSARAIGNGVDALGDPRVVAIKHFDADTAGCSGAAITPRIIVTAAHCLWGQDESPISGPLDEKAKIKVVPPGMLANSDKEVEAEVLAQFLSSDYSPSFFDPKTNTGRGPQIDIGFLVLDRPISEINYQIASFEQIREAVDKKQEFVAIGYGTKFFGDEGPNRDPTPTLTQVFVNFSYETTAEVEKEKLQSISEQPEFTKLLSKLQGDAAMGGGDSGSPLWLEDSGEWFYVGAMCCSEGRSSDMEPDHPFYEFTAGGTYLAAAGFPELFAEAVEYETRNPPLLIEPAEEDLTSSMATEGNSPGQDYSAIAPWILALLVVFGTVFLVRRSGK